MALRKINDPIVLHKTNPFMREDDARTLMNELREQYYHSAPVNYLRKIVIHKTTPFVREEISGIMQAFKGVDVNLYKFKITVHGEESDSDRNHLKQRKSLLSNVASQ